MKEPFPTLGKGPLKSRRDTYSELTGVTVKEKLIGNKEPIDYLISLISLIQIFRKRTSCPCSWSLSG